MRFPPATRASKSILSLAIGLALAARLGAQTAGAHVDHFAADDGLAQNFVRRVLQDRAGFIWVASERGLQRFDGYSFVPYAALDSGAPAALNRRITDLRQDSRGSLWAEAERVLYRIDPVRGSVIRSASDVDAHAWAPDSLGRVWILRAGRIDIVDASMTPVRAQPIQVPWASSAPNVFVATSRSASIWLVGLTNPLGNVVRLDASGKPVEWFRLSTITSPRAALEDRDGQLWVSGDGGVEMIDAESRHLRPVDELRGVLAGALAADGRGVVVATPTSVVRIDAHGRVTERWSPHEVFAPTAQVTAVALDRESGIWLGTLADGLFRVERAGPTFAHSSSSSSPPIPLASDFVMALAEQRDGSLWVGTLNGGAYRLSSDGMRTDVFRHDARDTTSLVSDFVWDIVEDRDGTVWIATSAGLCAVRNETTPPFVRCPDLASDRWPVTDVAVASDGWMWLASSDAGFIRSFEPSTRRFGRVVRAPQVFSLYVDADSGTLWVGGTSLTRARIKAGALLEPLHRAEESGGNEPRTVFAFHRDPRGTLWLGTDLGLQRWSTSSRQFESVDVPALRNTTVFSIAEDLRGSLWLGTAHGLVRYTPSSGVARRYRRQDGVLSGEFNRRAALRTRDGEMVFGGVQGLTRFHPDRVAQRRASPTVVFNRWTRVRENQMIEARLGPASGIELGPNDRAFSIDFAALTFAPGPAKRYRYRLEGLTREWLESTEHVVTYAAPPPGRYVFAVQATAGGEDEWESPGASLVLDVIPPFWRTSSFTGLVVATLVLLGWILHRLSVARAIATERLRLRISRDLHDELGAGLSSIALLSDSVGRAGAITERDRTQLQRIAHSAREMVADLRDIVWAIDPEGDKVSDVVSRMRDVTSALLRDVRVTFDAPTGADLSATIGMTARRDLVLVFKELLHNVARHAHASAVHIVLGVRGGELQLAVSDDGRGFDLAEARLGTGLKSMRERAARLGGRLDLSSEPGRGTTARLTIPRT